MPLFSPPMSGQPLDSDLTAIAALSTTAYGRALLALADEAAGRTALGLGTAATSASTDFQPLDSDLTAIAALTTTTFGRSLLSQADLAAAQATLGITAGASAYGPVPALNGFLDWTADPANMNGQAYLTVSGTMQGQAWTAGKSQNLTTLTYHATNAGTATAAYACLYTAAGALVVQSASAHAQFGSAGLKNFTIASTPVVAGTTYYACVWLVTASAPSFYCALGTDGDIWANVNRVAANFRTFTANTGLSSTAPGTIGTRTAARMPWVAFS